MKRRGRVGVEGEGGRESAVAVVPALLLLPINKQAVESEERERSP